MYVCVYVCVYVCMYVCVCVCVCVFVCISMYVCMYVCTYFFACIYVILYACMHVCITNLTRTALIRFNVSYNDGLLEDVWTFLDPEDTGVVKISSLTDFVFKHEPLRHKRTSALANGGMQQEADMGAQSQEHIQLLNAAAEKNQFARNLIHSIDRIQAAFQQVCVCVDSLYRTDAEWHEYRGFLYQDNFAPAPRWEG